MNAAEPADTPKRTRRRARWIVLGVIGLILLSAGGVFLDAWISAGKRLERDRTRVAEWVEQFHNQRAVIPNLFETEEDGNGFERFDQAWKLLEPLSSTDLEVFPSLAGDEEPKIDDAAIAAMCQALDPALQHLRRAVSCRLWEPHWKYDDLLTERRPSIAAAIRWNRILTDMAAHKHRTGDERGAFEFLAIGLWIGHALAAKGLVIEELVRFVTDGIQKETLKKFLADHHASAGDLAWLGRAVDRLESHRLPLMEALRRDDLATRQVLLKAFREGWSLDDVDKLNFMMKSDWGFRRYLPKRIVLAGLLQWQDANIQSQESVGTVEPWQRPNLSRQNVKGLEMDPSPLSMGGHYPRVWSNWLFDVHHMTFARLCLGVAEYEARNGHYPAKLQDLVPAVLAKVPIDPLNGKPFQYVNQGDSAQVISWGPDGDDDGGRAPMVDDDENGDGDIVWMIKRREAARK